MYWILLNSIYAITGIRLQKFWWWNNQDIQTSDFHLFTEAENWLDT